MLSTATTRSDAFVATPHAPSGASPYIASLYNRVAHAFVSNDEEVTADWAVAKAEIVATPCRTGADLATKLVIAMHEIAPHRQDGAIGFEPGDFPTDEAIQLLASAVNDALAMELPTQPFVDVLVAMMKANHVSLMIHDGELMVAFAQPGVAGRPSEPDGLDGIEGAQRALYALMCAVPGAIDAVRAALEGDVQ